MPIHDWKKVDAGIFHDFHHEWISAIKKSLNRGLLPPDYYALAEQIAGGREPDVLTLRGPNADIEPRGGLAVADAPPRVRFHARSEMDAYALKANAVVIRHRSGHQVIAMVELVSPGKSSRRALDAFVSKAEDSLAAGIHLLIVDLFAPTSRDPQGIHRAIWGDRPDDFSLQPDKPMTCASYIGGALPEAFVEPVGVGDTLPEMPLFLTPDVYVPVPLETTYQGAWDAVPPIWQKVLAGQSKT